MAADQQTPPRELTVGEVASRSGIAVSAVHFYEAQGLIHSWRSAGNQRRYPRGVLRRIAVIKVAQKAGVPLREIAQALADLPGGRPPTATDWARMSKRWQEELQTRIDRLSSLRDLLGDCIGCGCLSLEVCPLRNPDDQLGKKGPGARLLPTEAAD